MMRLDNNFATRSSRARNGLPDDIETLDKLFTSESAQHILQAMQVTDGKFT